RSGGLENFQSGLHNKPMSIVNTPLKYSGATNGATRRAMAIGQYVIAVVLTVVGMLRGLADVGALVIAAVAIGLLFLAWHDAGSWIPKCTDSLRLLRWWLIGLAALWVAAVAITAEYIWLAFLLWLLAGHLLPGRGALVFSLV